MSNSTTTHACPTGHFSTAVTPCCDQKLTNLPEDDRIASDPSLVTCTGGAR